MSKRVRKFAEEFYSRRTMIRVTVSCWAEGRHVQFSQATRIGRGDVRPSLRGRQRLLLALAAAHHHSRRRDEYISEAACLECGINKQVTSILF